jgi:hypothetical protein
MVLFLLAEPVYSDRYSSYYNPRNASSAMAFGR